MPATEPGQLHELFLAGVNGKDAAALLALYEPTAVAVNLDGTSSTGEAALRTMIDGLLSTIDHIDGMTRKVMVSGDIALLSGTWQARITTPDGTGQASGTTAEIARRQPDGTWRWILDDPAFL